jgi:hypothetical protein
VLRGISEPKTEELAGNGGNYIVMSFIIFALPSNTVRVIT